jgi:hypothetical protein
MTLNHPLHQPQQQQQSLSLLHVFFCVQVDQFDFWVNLADNVQYSYYNDAYNADCIGDNQVTQGRGGFDMIVGALEGNSPTGQGVYFVDMLQQSDFLSDVLGGAGLDAEVQFMAAVSGTLARNAGGTPTQSDVRSPST